MNGRLTPPLPAVLISIPDGIIDLGWGHPQPRTSAGSHATGSHACLHDDQSGHAAVVPNRALAPVRIFSRLLVTARSLCDARCACHTVPWGCRKPLTWSVRYSPSLATRCSLRANLLFGAAYLSRSSLACHGGTHRRQDCTPRPSKPCLIRQRRHQCCSTLFPRFRTRRECAAAGAPAGVSAARAAIPFHYSSR